MNKNKKNRKGFTIVELVIVIAVIGILATVLVPTFGNVISDAKEKAALQEAKNIYTSYVTEHVDEASFTTDADKLYVTVKNITFKCNGGNLTKHTAALTTGDIELTAACAADCSGHTAKQ